MSRREVGTSSWYFGDFIIGADFRRTAVAYDDSARMKYRGDPLDTIVRDILTNSKRKVRGGIIAVSQDGEITMQVNTWHGPRAG